MSTGHGIYLSGIIAHGDRIINIFLWDMNMVLLQEKKVYLKQLGMH